MKKHDQNQVINKEDFDKLQSEFDDLQNQLKRAVADYQNLEKRVAEGRSELSSWATGELVRKLLPSLDHFEKAVEGASDNEKESAWFKGVEMALKQLQAVLHDEGLDEIRADGEFDPALHEAVDTRTGEDNKILEVAEKGYTLNGKVIKPAKVVVGRKE